MLAYIDESGDLGWTLDRPFRKGGSSQFLTISFLLTPNDSKKFPKRLVRDLYMKFGIPPYVEIKGTELKSDQRKYFVQKTIHMMEIHPEIRILSISVQKSNVAEHIRADGNKLYNYMIGLILLDEISTEETVTLVPDPRQIAVKSGNSLLDYLQTKLWFDMCSKTVLNTITISSENSLNIKFIDIVTNIMWRKYENNDAYFADLLSPKTKSKRLFFNE
ncbi:MAG: DUF3800 domain-containing protein [Chloroflexi bacterium]|nr:DUF3800 domain-containing protein [Chloroflexota bacterium]